MTTLPEFIEIGRTHGQANLHLKVPDFKVFYARYGRRWLNGTVYRNVLDFSTIEVKEKLRRTGVCTRLIKQVQQDYPEVSIYVENCSSELIPLMLKLGFTRHDSNPDCFFQLGNKCSELTSMTGAIPAVGSSSGYGSKQNAGTGTTTTSKATESESSGNEDSICLESSSITARSITMSKRRKPTW